MRKQRRILSEILAVSMLVTMLAAPVCAEEDSYEIIEECTHQHTAECYPEPDDEEASPSDYKALEPTECTHVCDENTGCIRKVSNYQIYGTEEMDNFSSGDGWEFDSETGTMTYTDDAGYDDRVGKIEREQIKSVIIGEEVTVIPIGAFSGCVNLKSVEIQSNFITSIEDMAFYQCPITSIEIPDSVTVIEEAVFTQSRLNSIRIPAGVEAIGAAAFSQCFKLKAIQFDGNTPPELGDSCFELLSETGTVTVPGGTEDAYKAALSEAGMDFGDGGWTIIGVKESHIVRILGGGFGADGDGCYTEGDTVSIYAGIQSGHTFAGWSGSVAFADAADADTTFIMPDADVTVTANWAISGDGSSADESSSDNGSSGSSVTSYREALPKGYTGETKILHNFKVPAYAVDGSWRIADDGHWKLRGAVGVDFAGCWVFAYNPYADTSKSQMAFDWFLFDADGCLVTGWYTDAQGNTFYLNPSSDNTKGAMAVGWLTIDGTGYYFSEESDGTRGKLK